MLFLLLQISTLPFKEPHKHLERAPGLQERLHSLTPTALYDPVALCKVGTSQMCWSIQRNKHPWCSEDLLLPAAGKLEMLGCSSQHSSLGTLRASLQTLISWGTVTGNLPKKIKENILTSQSFTNTMDSFQNSFGRSGKTDLLLHRDRRTNAVFKGI